MLKGKRNSPLSHCAVHPHIHSHVRSPIYPYKLFIIDSDRAGPESLTHQSNSNMRLSVPVSIVLLLAASMPAFAVPISSSNTVPQTHPQLEQRSPLLYGFIAEELFRRGVVRSSAVLVSDQRAEHKHFGAGYPRL